MHRDSFTFNNLNFKWNLKGSKGPNGVGVCLPPPPSLEDGTETLCFLVFGILDGVQSPETQ
jgi:hypothetical protein